MNASGENVKKKLVACQMLHKESKGQNEQNKEAKERTRETFITFLVSAFGCIELLSRPFSGLNLLGQLLHIELLIVSFCGWQWNLVVRLRMFLR